MDDLTASQALLIIGCSILGLLGLIHLVLTLFTRKFDALDPLVTEAMESTSPVISKQTSMWSAWVGFNLSHSLGMLFFSATYIPLAVFHYSVIEQSMWFAVLPSMLGVSYLILAKKYWFKAPFWGMVISTLCFVSGSVIIVIL